MEYRRRLSAHLPESWRFWRSFLRNCFHARDASDNSGYWRARAKDEDQKAVLWSNQDYNRLYRERQRAILGPYVRDLERGAHVLDIGCGIGVVAAMLRGLNRSAAIDAVDFPEMIARARREYGDLPGVAWIASPAEDFLGPVRYDLIVSSACYSAIRNLETCRRAMDNGARMLKPGGTLLMIDPWHRFRPLARARMNSRDVAGFLKARGLRLVRRNGVLFWPYRVVLSNSAEVAGEAMRRKFDRGERLLRWMGPHFWADYKILEFRKDA